MKTISFEISDEAFEEINEKIRLAALESHRDYFDNAITIFNWAIDQAIRGRDIASVNEKSKKYEPITMPCLDYVATRRLRSI